MFEYLNVVEWLVALVSLIAWARFATFMANDVTKNLVDLPELPWKLGGGGVMLLMLMVWLVMPSFWIALPVNILIAGGMIAAFWTIRVKILGPAGHLFKRALDVASSASNRMEERRSARQVQLTYLRHDNTLMPLPKPGDPLAAGLGVADQLVIQALIRRAELVEIVPSESSYSIAVVTDGVPYPQPPLARATGESAIQALKVLAGLTADERRRPQVGTFRSRDADASQTTWTVRTSGTTAGERASLHANEKGLWDIKIDQLGFTSEQLADVKALAGDTQGLVLVTGPRGSGRTTTLYSLLRMHDAFTNSVQTLEINSQTEIEGVTVNRFDMRSADASYAKTLQSILLKDPNILLTAQIPDAQTAESITKFTSGGYGSEPRRVYAALSAPDAFSALEQWLSLNPNRMEAAAVLRVIIAQRLVRILCPTCKIPYQPDEATMKRLNLPMGRNLQSFKANTEPIVDRKGHKIICPDCAGIGFRGRTGIFEVLVMTDEIKKALAGGAGQNQLRLLARKNNMLLMVEHGIRKFATGITAINEVTRVMSPPDKTPSASRTGVNPAQSNLGNTHMFFNFFVVLLIVLITLFLAGQGMISALLALVTAIFGSLLAMGLTEALLGPMVGFRPEYARGVTFLLLFFLAFSACRIGADIAVPKNIRLPVWFDRGIGGFIGFFAGLVVLGTMIIGIEMLPLPRSLLMYDRYPEDKAMQEKVASESGEAPLPGVMAKPSGVWFLPDRFVLTLWKGASGRGLGGNRSWNEVHPDLSVESYGYRNVVQKGSRRTLPPELFSVPMGWMTDDPKKYQPLGIAMADAGKRVVMVRTVVKKGEADNSAKESHDPGDDWFRITPTQVRLVTDKGNQYYPLGYLRYPSEGGGGQKFVPLPLDSGHVVEDYVGGADATDDWVFEIGSDEKPMMLEMKELARADLGTLVKEIVDKDTLPPALARNRYPQQPYLSNNAQLTLTLHASVGEIKSGKVWVLSPGAPQKDLLSEVRSAFNRVVQISDTARAGGGGWVNPPKPGVPDIGAFSSALNAQTIINEPDPNRVISWQEVMNVLLLGQAKPDGLENLRIYPQFFRDTLEPLWRGISTGSVIRATADVGPSGKVEFDKIPAGTYCVVAILQTDKSFYVWLDSYKFEPKGHPVWDWPGEKAPMFKVEVP